MRPWLKVAIPFTVLTALVGGTLIVHAVQTPDADDPSYLAPDRIEQISGGTLAERLRAQGVTVERTSTTEQAVAAVRSGAAPATLFVTTPDLADLTAISALPAGTRVVAVAPSDSALRRSSWPVQAAASHWTTQVTAPNCSDKLATTAGPAAVLRHEYQPLEGASICYSGAVVTMRVNNAYTLTVVGSPDPFRDDRIGEHGNAALAVGLLSQNERVVWLDVHVRDRPVQQTPPPVPDETVSPEPGTGSEDGGGSSDGGQNGQEGDESAGESGTQSEQQDDRNPLFDALPPVVWASLILLALILLALAAAAARRLGTPVAEPLPSLVPANETMLGHARLYQRARARKASLALIVTAARGTLTRHLALPTQASTEDIAAKAGLPVRYVRDILDGEPPRSNADLVEAATLVQLLVREVTNPQDTHEGEQS